jgi:hypothetical protein
LTRPRRRENNFLLSKSSNLSRRIETIPVKKTVVVVCEGTKTEPDYLEALADDPAVRNVAAVKLRLESANRPEVPLKLVRRASELNARDRKEGGEIDEVWCVFDVEWPEHHPNLREALEMAASNGIRVAVSNPCFELWLALHFERVTRFLTNSDARRERERWDSAQGKSVDASKYLALREVACAHGEGLDDMHRRNGTTFPHDNPSTGVYKLVRSVTAAPPGPSKTQHAR